jgi:tetratricopeptide (TPR) repeat protein
MNKGIAPMMSGIRPFLALTGALLAAPLAADEPAADPLPDLAAMDAKVLVALFTQDENRWSREPCTFGAPLLVELETKAARPIPVRRVRLLAQALCADREKRYADGAQLVGEIAKLTPDEPETGMAIYFANRLEDPDGMLAVLRALNDTGLGQLDEDDYWLAGSVLTRNGRGSDFDALALAWAEGGKLAFIDTQLHESVAIRALRAAAVAGRGDLADQLLLPITSPTAYIRLLTSREFEPLWPQIEMRAGPNLTLVGDEHVRATRIRFTNAPNDRDRFSDAAHALHYNGQFAEAITLAQRWREREARGVGIEEGDAWALNIEAYAYDSLGQPKQADKVFDDLAKLDPEEHNWVVNFVINRASRLVGQGRWKQGLAATELARKVAETQGSTYAKLIIASDRACALQRLGRARDAQGELAFLRDNWKDGVRLTVRGLLCHGLKDEAEQLLIAGLRDESLRDFAINAFETDELDLFYTATTLPQAGDMLPDYPELAAELAKHMRPIPEAYIPQAALKRVARKEGAGS